MEPEERRAHDVRRIPIATLVEICGQDPSVPNFEAESVEVSGRGMCVRTTYLPEVGAPLVCRFEDRGREVLVEGEVAWRDEDARGGEFGIRFTALDARSVDVLKDLCGSGLGEVSPLPPATEDGERLAGAGEAGARVRLHIDGLGSPMKARVREGSRRRVDVGSNLEFLRVGKALELEGTNERREAVIDAVTVAIDPQTQIPQLVVTLRYTDVVDATPEPSVIGDDHEDGEPSDEAPMLHSAPAPMASAASTVDLTEEHVDAADPGDEILEEADAFKSRASRIAVGAGAAMTAAGGHVAKMSSRAAVGLGRFLAVAQGHMSAKVGEIRERRGNRPVRTTTAPPSGALSSGLVRRQSAGAGESRPTAEQPRPTNTKRRIIAGAALLSVVVGGAAFAMSGGAHEPPGAAATKGPVTSEAVAVDDVLRVDEQGNPLAPVLPAVAVAATPAAPPPPPQAALPAAPADESGGVTANIPLFGPTPMATMEPAPLEAPEDPAAATGATPGGVSSDDPAVSKPAVADEAWEEDGASAIAKKPQPEKVDPSSVAPWGRGTVRTPTIHRLRLDAPGAAIQGAINPTGFTIVVPGRKTIESGTAIAKRDKRIAVVRTRNTSSGAQIAFQFRDGVPAYRVRLRKDYVEFLISAPAEKKSAAAGQKH